MHAKTFQNQKDTIWTQTPSKAQEGTPRCDTKKVVQIISKTKSTHDQGKIKTTNDLFQHINT